MAKRCLYSLARHLPLLLARFFGATCSRTEEDDMTSTIRTRLTLAAAVAAMLPLAAAIAQTPPPSDTPQEPQQRGATFESLDANGDGKISKEEAAANESVSS